MILRLVTGIVALVLDILGVTFLVLGLALSGNPEADAFRTTGAAILAGGLILTAVFMVLRRRQAAERRRRQEGARAVAEIVEAELHPYVRIGVMLTMTVTVRYLEGVLGDRTFTRKLLVPPTMPLKAGDRVELLHDPADPGNFEPVALRTG